MNVTVRAVFWGSGHPVALDHRIVMVDWVCLKLPCDYVNVLTLTLILFLQPETTATFGSIHRLCHSNYDLSTPTCIRSFELAIKSPVILLRILAPLHLALLSATLLARRR
jgi:hypothetical protein